MSWFGVHQERDLGQLSDTELLEYAKECKQNIRNLDNYLITLDTEAAEYTNAQSLKKLIAYGGGAITIFGIATTTVATLGGAALALAGGALAVGGMSLQSNSERKHMLRQPELGRRRQDRAFYRQELSRIDNERISRQR